MSISHIHKTVYKVSDFLSWQRVGSLDLSPNFQRRQVWSPGAKSYFMDTVIKGLPIPIVFLRERIDPRSLEPIREVVDGQQRLRTLIAFIDSSMLKDINVVADTFTIKKVHNRLLAGKVFKNLPPNVRQDILNYEFSTHVLTSDTEDRDILQIFARMNATGVRLNGQELRNAKYFGAFKERCYSLAYEQLERWRAWKVFSESEIARMKEVEETSDLIIFMLEGNHGKTQARLNKYYERNDDEFEHDEACSRRFRAVLDEMDSSLGDRIANTNFAGQSMFYSLFCLFYEEMYGGKGLSSKGTPNRITKSAIRELMAASDRIDSSAIPDELQKVLRGASTDRRAREVRLDFLRAAVASV